MFGRRRHAFGQHPASRTVHCRRCGTATTQDPRGDGHPGCPQCGLPDWINPAPAVGVVIRRRDQVLLARRAGPPKEGEWDMIGGFVEPGETIPEAARREAKEETGLELGPIKRLHQAPGEYRPGTPTLNFIYVAEARTDMVPVASDDVAELRWWPLDALPPIAWPHEADALEKLRG